MRKWNVRCQNACHTASNPWITSILHKQNIGNKTSKSDVSNDKIYFQTGKRRLKQVKIVFARLNDFRFQFIVFPILAVFFRVNHCWHELNIHAICQWTIVYVRSRCIWYHQMAQMITFTKTSDILDILPPN